MPGLQRYFRMEKFVFKCVGLSLEKTDSVYYKIYSVSIILLLNVTYPILQLGDLFKHDFDVASDILIYEIGMFISLGKTLVMYLNRRRIAGILDKLQRAPLLDNAERGGETEGHLMKECAFIITAQTLTYLIAISLALCLAFVSAFAKRIKSSDFRDWELPYGPLTVLNITYSPNYEITLAYQSLSMLFIVFHYSLFDSLLYGVLCYMVYQFKMLQHNIKYMVRRRHAKTVQNKYLTVKELSHYNTIGYQGAIIPWGDLKISLKETVEYHLAIIEVIDEIEDMFNSLLLVKFLGTLFFLCFVVYTTSLIPTADPKMIRFTMEFLSGCIQIFFVCFWGEQIDYDCQQVAIAAFNANLVGQDVRFQKALILIIRRSQKAVRLTVGKFAPVCLSTFAWIVRASWSAFLVLRNVNE